MTLLAVSSKKSHTPQTRLQRLTSRTYVNKSTGLVYLLLGEMRSLHDRLTVSFLHNVGDFYNRVGRRRLASANGLSQRYYNNKAEQNVYANLPEQTRKKPCQQSRNNWILILIKNMGYGNLLCEQLVFTVESICITNSYNHDLDNAENVYLVI